MLSQVPLRHARRLSGRWLPQGPLDALRQLALVAAAYYAYRLVRGFVDGQATVAFENARTIISIESDLRLFFEPGLQEAVQRHAELALTLSNWMYVNTHFLLTTGFLVWLYVARNGSFYFVRNMFVVSMALALLGYLALPTAPPRFLPEWGFEDTVADWVGPAAEASAGALYNPFAAVPSMHVAFALMIAVPAVRLVRHRPPRIAWMVYPALVTFVVIVTANHFWLDAALGAAVAALSAWAADALARVRPEAWSWRPARARAAAR